MECRIAFVVRGLYCETHHSKGMSSICDVAEQELRDRIVELVTKIVELELEVLTVHNTGRR